MDKLKEMAQQVKGATGSSSSGNKASGSEDYADKGLDAIEKKTGHSTSRATNEKITDEGRSLYEKETGKSVSSKFSN